MIAENLGHTPRHAWLRVRQGQKRVILTLSRDVLPYGTASARWLEIDLDSPIRGHEPPSVGFFAEVTVHKAVKEPQP